MNDAPAADPASGPEPVADRPHVPEYAIPTDLAGLLPWGWATERLTTFGWSDYPADATRWRFPAG